MRIKGHNKGSAAALCLIILSSKCFQHLFSNESRAPAFGLIMPMLYDAMQTAGSGIPVKCTAAPGFACQGGSDTAAGSECPQGVGLVV